MRQRSEQWKIRVQELQLFEEAGDPCGQPNTARPARVWSRCASDDAGSIGPNAFGGARGPVP
jgi:hypothetical protein